eukprot:1195819-Prorocentrum_minimum.AAC.5
MVNTSVETKSLANGNRHAYPRTVDVPTHPTNRMILPVGSKLWRGHLDATERVSGWFTEQAGVQIAKGGVLGASAEASTHGCYRLCAQTLSAVGENTHEGTYACALSLVDRCAL